MSAPEAWVVICEGQGAVVPGKGKDLWERDPVFRTAFSRVQALTGIDLAGISWGADRFKVKSDPHLSHVYAFAHQYAQFESLKAEGLAIRALTGHSLGELIALVCAGAVPLEDGFRFIDVRGRLFARNATASGSDMLAIIGPESEVTRVAQEAEADPKVFVANRNSPSQIVLAVATADIPRLQAWFQGKGLRTVALGVGNGCHSPYVAAIQDELAAAADAMHYGKPALPFYSATFGEFFDAPETIRSAVRAHLMAQVPWRFSMQTFLDGCGFIELGYAKVLKGFLLEMDRGCRIQMFEGRRQQAGAAHA